MIGGPTRPEGTDEGNGDDEGDMSTTLSDAALVIIDPQNEVLSEHGLAWDLVGQSVTENRTVEEPPRALRERPRR